MKFFKSLPFVLAFFLPSLALASGGGGYWLSPIVHATHLPEHVVTFIFLGLLIAIAGVVYQIQMAKKPHLGIVPDNSITFRNIVEALGEFIYNLARNTMGEKEAKNYYDCVGMIFIFIFISNFIGLIPGFFPPTENINTTIGLGLFVFLYYNYQGIRAQGVVGHIKHFMGPVWYLAVLIFPIEIISHFVRPVSLGLRLRGNIFGDHLVVGIFSSIVPYIVPIPFLALGIFVSFMQAFVFTLLTMVYIGMATAHHDHDEHAEHH